MKIAKTMIGYILFNEFDEGVYEIGWIYNRNCWRQGYAYESCKTVIDYAFTELKTHKFFAEAIDAVKSVGLMKKLGTLPRSFTSSLALKKLTGMRMRSL